MDYYTVSEVAKLLGVTRQRVLQLVQSKKIVAHRLGQSWVIHKSDYKVYASSRKKGV